MKPPPFEYHRPRSVPEALAYLNDLDGDVKLLAGGQSLVPMLNFRVVRPDHLIDLNDLSELDYVCDLGDAIEVGAMVRHQRVATDPIIRVGLPLLSQGAATIGHFAIRQRGTLGGSLAHADPAAQLPLLAMLLDASLLCRSATRNRELPAVNFFESIMTTALDAHEILVGVRFPKPATGVGWGFEIFSQRHGDFAIVVVAALLACNGAGRVSNLRLAIGGVAATPVRFDSVTAHFVNELPNEGWTKELAHAVEGACEVEETRIPATFRRELVQILTERAATAALTRAREGSLT